MSCGRAGARVSTALWVGTYPAPGTEPGSGEGVWRVEVATDGTFSTPRLVAATPSPSFLALHPSGRTLYAVAEEMIGSVAAFPVVDGALGAPVRVPSGGAAPCHLLARSDDLWIANYVDGVASTVPVDPVTGELTSAVPTCFPGAGSGPRADRQEGPHAHSSVAAGDDVVVVDLGADTLRRYPASPGPSQGEPGTAAILPPGTGPRHVAALPGGSLAVVGELDVRLHVLVPAPGGWETSSSTPASASVVDREVLPSHVTVTDDLLLVGIRGADTLAVHRWAVGTDGIPRTTLLAEISLGAGAWPRHHEVVGEALDGRLVVVVARQGTSDLATVLVDRASGQGEIVATLSLPTPPACIVISR